MAIACHDNLAAPADRHNGRAVPAGKLGHRALFILHNSPAGGIRRLARCAGQGWGATAPTAQIAPSIQDCSADFGAAPTLFDTG